MKSLLLMLSSRWGGEKRQFGQVFCVYHRACFLPCLAVLDGYAPP